MARLVSIMATVAHNADKAGRDHDLHIVKHGNNAARPSLSLTAEKMAARVSAGSVVTSIVEAVKMTISYW